MNALDPRPESLAPSAPGAAVLPEAFARGSLRLGLAGGGGLRWAVADLTEVVEAARGRLDLSPVASAALGRSLAGSALLLRMAAKTPTRLVVEIKGDGPLGRVIAEADDLGNLRGMVGDPRADVPARPDGKLAVGAAVGKGLLRVLREHGTGSYASQVELVSGEIGDDLAHYLDQSQQIRSTVLLGVLARPAGVAGAGGMIVEALPGATEAALSRLEANLAAMTGVSHLVADGSTEGVLEAVLAGFDRQELESADLYYRCRCTRERLGRHLALLAADDLASLRLPDGTVEAECVFCASRYQFCADELG